MIDIFHISPRIENWMTKWTTKNKSCNHFYFFFILPTAHLKQIPKPDEKMEGDWRWFESLKEKKIN